MVDAEERMACRVGCGACCIAPSISSSLPGHPEGKPAGVRCVHLTAANLCELWGSSQYPAVCRGFQPQAWVCGDSASRAMRLLTALEQATC